ncbi:MAG TPA: hypothetical protein VES40_18410 [Ilumatobacteraceae bacterium]|nr:hypothetical protein [Ilumatobacteraceae bacterium]
MDGGDRYAQARAKTYAALASSPSLSARVIADLGLDLEPDALAGRVTATNPPNTALIEISVSAPSASDAQQRGTVFLSEYMAMVRELESVPGALVPRAELVVVDPPGRASRVIAWGAPLSVVLLGAGLLGMILGATAAVLRSVFEGSARDQREELAITEARTTVSVRGETAGRQEREG